MTNDSYCLEFKGQNARALREIPFTTKQVHVDLINKSRPKQG